MTASVSRTSKQSAQEATNFPRTMRLLRHADFERVYKQGRRQFATHMTIFYLERKGEADGTPAKPAGLRVGFTVGRALGGAVHRNRMKRRLRSAVRLSHPPRQLSADVVINPKKSLLTADFAGVLNEIEHAFVVIEQKLGAKGSIAPRGDESGRRTSAGSR
ncbi:MAG TPA: ribonuclease P protein component [Candidatus Sulfotelmatobacter sp.]|nr:ribonuclease P protein component [Candidatus Sulfotelmatobacter sp.]